MRVFAGEVPEWGAPVLLHRADGTVVAQTTTESDGSATVTGDGELVSTALTLDVNDRNVPDGLFTTSAEFDPLDLHLFPHVVAHGPSAGKLTISSSTPVPDGVDLIVDLGCETLGVGALPATIDVPQACLGDGQQLDLAVSQNLGAPTVCPTIPMSAARLTMNGDTTYVATFEDQPQITNVEVVPDVLLGGMDLWADGHRFRAVYCVASPGQPIYGVPGLHVDGRSIGALLGDETVTARYAGDTDAIMLSPAEVPPIGRATVPTMTAAPLTLTLAPPTGGPADAVGVGDGAWFAIVPPDMTSLTYPTLDADLAARFPAPQGTPSETVWNTAQLTGFADVAAAGIDVGGPRIAAGDIAVSVSTN